MTIVPSVSTTAVPLSVFISYSRHDNYDIHLARTLEEALSVRKIDAFLDERVEAGDLWSEAWAEGMARATHFVVILSAESKESDWVRLEIKAALKRPRDQLRIISIRRSDRAKFPELDDVQWISPEIHKEVETIFGILRLPWLEDGRAPTSSRMHERRADSQYQAELCDRGGVERQFRDAYPDFLRTRPSTPQAYFIVGREDEQHNSFIDRLKCTYLDDEAKVLSSAEHTATVEQKTIDWPERWDRKHEKAALIANVFDAFFDRYSRRNTDFTSAAFATKNAELSPAVVEVRHAMPGRRWDRTLIADYLRFWRGAGAGKVHRLFFLFFNVSVCHELDEKCAICGATYKSIEALAAARRSKSSVPATLLALPCVKRSDVGNWFRDRPDAHFRHIDATMAALFPNGDGCQPMSRVEEVLRGVCVKVADQQQLRAS